MKTKKITVVLLGVLVSLFFLGCQKKVTKTVPLNQKMTSIEKSQVAEDNENFDEFVIEDNADVSVQDSKIVFATIHFDFDKYELTPLAREILAEHARLLKANPSVKLIIEGHCDERGTIEYNLALGERRAVMVKKYLQNYGLQPDRFSVISFGKERPMDNRQTEEAWAKNRRAAFVISQQ